MEEKNNIIQTKYEPAHTKSHLLLILLLALVTFTVYSSIFDHKFLNTWDDNVYVTANETIRGFTLDHLWTAFTKFYVGNYAPVQIISYMLDYSLWQLNAGGFLLSNIVFHAANGILFYLLLIRIHQSRRLAFLAAFLFLCHPVQVESVAWVSERKNLLAMFFFLISFHFYLAYSDKGEGKGRLEYSVSFIAFALALLSKVISIILPPIIILYDLCFKTVGAWRRGLTDKLPFMAAATVMALITYISQTPGKTPSFGSSLATLYTMLPVFVRYLRIVVWPADLCAEYALPVRTVPDMAVLLSSLFFVLLIIFGVYLFRHRRELFFWFAIFFIGLVPVSHIIPLTTQMNDRYLYFPMLGAAVLLGKTALFAVDSVHGKTRAAVIAILCVLLMALPFAAFKQTAVWQDSFTLWTDVTTKYPNDCDAWGALGDAHMESRNWDAALAAYKSNQFVCRDYLPTLEKIAVVHMIRMELLESRAYIQRLFRDNPVYYASGMVLLAKNYYLAGELQKAEETMNKALLLQPNDSEMLHLRMLLRGNVIR